MKTREVVISDHTDRLITPTDPESPYNNGYMIRGDIGVVGRDPSDFMGIIGSNFPTPDEFGKINMYDVKVICLPADEMLQQLAPPPEALINQLMGFTDKLMGVGRASADKLTLLSELGLKMKYDKDPELRALVDGLLAANTKEDILDLIFGRFKDK